jgi:hypothetical protein
MADGPASLLDILSFLGSAFSKPARMLRGPLGGNPRELLNFIPFSDSLGITDPKEEVSGSQLFGLGEDANPLLKLLAEVGTDPLTYAGAGLAAKFFAPGLMRQAGQAARSLPGELSGALGRLAQDAKEFPGVLRQGLGEAGGAVKSKAAEIADWLADTLGAHPRIPDAPRTGYTQLANAAVMGNHERAMAAAAAAAPRQATGPYTQLANAAARANQPFMAADAAARGPYTMLAEAAGSQPASPLVREMTQAAQPTDKFASAINGFKQRVAEKEAARRAAAQAGPLAEEAWRRKQRLPMSGFDVVRAF